MPTQRDESDEEAEGRLLKQQSLFEAIRHYQEVHGRWSTDLHEDHRVRLNEEMGLAHEKLWAELEEPLYKAARWLISKPWIKFVIDQQTHNPSDLITTLAMIAYTNLVEELPKLVIDPSQNVIAYLKTTTRNKLYDEYLKLTRQKEHQIDSLDLPAHPGTQQTLGDELPDPASLIADEATVTKLARNDCLREIMAYWAMVLNDIDRLIVRERWLKHEPTPFSAIAVLLGDGWSEGTVRQRHHRILDRTMKYLKKGGWPFCP